MKKISLTDSEINDLLDLYQSEIDRAQRRINNLKSIIEKLSESKTNEPTIEKKIEKQSVKSIEKLKGKRGRKPKMKVVQQIPVVDKKEEIKEKTNKEVPKKILDKDRKSQEKALKEAKAVIIVEEKKEPQKRGRKKKEDETKVVKTKKRGRKKKTAKAKAAPKKRGRKPKSLRKPIKGGKGKEKVRWNDFILETIKSKNSLMLASSLTQAALEKFQIPNSDRDRVRMAISTTLTKMANKDKILKTHLQPGLRGAFFGLSQWFNSKNELTSDYKKKLM